MYKATSRFRQSLARKGRKLTGRNLVAADSKPGREPVRTRLHAKLDQEVGAATDAAEAGYDAGKATPRLVKVRKRPPSN